MAPIFDLYCTACNIAFERMVKSGDPIKCPSCESDSDVKKLPSVFAGYSIAGDNSASTGTPRHFKRESG